MIPRWRLRPSHGLDGLNFLVAGAQTAFGAFIPGYLVAHGWTQAEIGIVLTVQTATTIALQIPAGALVDATRRRGMLLAASVLLLGFAGLLLGVFPARLPVAIALILQASASGVIYPAIAAISLAVVGRAGLSERFGRNASFSAVGGGIGAATMGGLATLLPGGSVFLFAAVLAFGAVVCLQFTRVTRRAILAAAQPEPAAPTSAWNLLRDRRVLVFAGCVILFNLASAALVPVAAAEMTRRIGPRASMLIAVWVIVPQVVVVLFAPLAGRLAERIGRRPVLIAGFATLPLRALCFALIANPYLLTPAQVFDGIAGATFGVLTPLIANDMTRGTNRASLCLAMFGLAGAFGAALSTTLSGVTATMFGAAAAFGLMAGAGLLAVLVAFFLLPETRAQA